jgi:hypothetical protein
MRSAPFPVGGLKPSNGAHGQAADTVPLRSSQPGLLVSGGGGAESRSCSSKKCALDGGPGEAEACSCGGLVVSASAAQQYDSSPAPSKDGAFFSLQFRRGRSPRGFLLPLHIITGGGRWPYIETLNGPFSPAPCPFGKRGRSQKFLERDGLPKR